MRLVDTYRKRRFEDGGDMERAQKMEALATGGASVIGMVGSAFDALDTPNKYGHQKAGTTALKGAASGAQMGAALGPWGMAAGAVVGAGIGLVQANKQKQEARRLDWAEAQEKRQLSLSQYQARAAQDPSIATGNVGGGYFENGGSLYSTFLKQKAKGGSLQRLSSDTVEVKGPSHEGGGVQLPGGNEVEGQETIKGDYVLSEKLGFAQLHKPIAKAIGKLEQRPATRATLTSLKRLREKEDAIILLQEIKRQQLNLA